MEQVWHTPFRQLQRAAAAQAADRLDIGGGRALAQVRDQRRRGVMRLGQQVAAGMPLPFLEGLAPKSSV